MQKTSIKEAFLRHFPVPRYIGMSAAGIDISDFSVKVLEFSHLRKRRLKKVTTKGIPSGIIQGGEILKPEGLIKILKELKEELNLHFIRASLPEEHAYLFSEFVPKVSATQIRNLLEFKLEENVPLKASDVYFDFEFPNHNKRRTSKHVETVVSVFPRVIADTYLELFQKAGLSPLSFEIEAQAIARALIAKHDKGTHMIVDFGRARSGITIVCGGVVHYTTTIDIGGDAITSTIKKINPEMSDKQIIETKNTKGCRQSDDNKELCNSLMTTMSALRDEINRHLDYWRTYKEKDHRNKVDDILLCGGNANIAGLPEYLSVSMKIPVKRANVWVNAFDTEEYIPPLTKQQSLEYASAIGLALE
jgi:type IV pilus assembly protein PilM